MKSEENIESEVGELRLYELGYHIIPTVSEDALGEKVSEIRGIIDSHHGEISLDETPKIRDLAYPLTKIFENKRKQFETAYFGWMIFKATPEDILVIKDEIDAHESVLRFILVKTVEEKKPVVSSKKMAFLTKDNEEGSDAVVKETLLKKKDDKKDDKKELSEAELDKTIEELVVE